MRGTLVDKVWPSDPTLYAPAKYRRACKYKAFIPDPLAGFHFTLSSDVAGVVSDAEQATMRLNSRSRPVLAPLARLLLRTESIASSKVEGLQVGVRELARAESRLGTGAKASPTTREVLGNIDAMEVAVEEAATVPRLALEHITAIHFKLMAKAPDHSVAGLVREGQNWIGGNDYNPCGADYVPPPPEHVRGLLVDLCEAIADDSLPPLVQAAMIHAQFETIHPFDDGNGRTGRALIHVVLRRRGIAPSYVPPISVVFGSDRDGYINGLTDFRSGDVGAWIERFAAAAATAAGLALSCIDAVEVQTERWRHALAEGASPRSDAAAWAIIETLPAYPVITAPAAARATGRAKAAIHQAIGQLVEAGVLLPLSDSKRNRSWEASGLLDLLEGLEAGTAPGSTQ